MDKAEEQRGSDTFIQQRLLSTVKKGPIILHLVLVLSGDWIQYKQSSLQGVPFPQKIQCY